MKCLRRSSAEALLTSPWSSLVEGDEQLDRPLYKQLWNYAMHVLHNFLGFNIHTTAFCLG